MAAQAYLKLGEVSAESGKLNESLSPFCSVIYSAAGHVKSAGSPQACGFI